MSRLGSKTRRDQPPRTGQDAPDANRQYVITATVEQYEQFPHMVDNAHLAWFEANHPASVPTDKELASVTLRPVDFEPAGSVAFHDAPATSIEEAIARIEEPQSERGARLRGLYRERLERRRGER